MHRRLDDNKSQFFSSKEGMLANTYGFVRNDLLECGPGLNWLKTGSSGGLLWTQYCIFIPYRQGRFNRLINYQLLCNTELYRKR